MNQSAKTSQRAISLDALRGFAILTMVLSGVIPYAKLPSWMYHAQLPPPDHVFNPELPGLTWVDLVFPMFLFALGTAIPLAISKRLQSGDSHARIVYYIVERSALLGFFAIFLRHVRPHVLNPTPDRLTWLIALTGFVVMFALFLRIPERWGKNAGLRIRAGGWLAALVMLLYLKYPDGSGFSLYRSDIIIIVLANTYLFGSLIWLISRKSLLLRLGVLGILLGLRLAQEEPGWVNWLWNASPVPWFYKLYYLQYLFIVIPGTIIGDLFLKRGQETENPQNNGTRSGPSYFAALFLVLLILIFVLLIGFQARWTVLTTLVTLTGTGFVLVINRNPASGLELLLRQCLVWSAYWIVLGLIFEPFEGGIKKDQSTLSYYFVTTAISIWILVLFLIISEYWKRPQWLSLLADNGKNPMIAYVGMANLIWPVLGLTGADKVIESISGGPLTGLLRAIIYTIVLAYLVRLFSRKRLYWRT